MDVFDKLGEKITEAGKAIASKAKELTDVASIRTSINEEEKKILSAYQDMGLLYYEKHKADGEEAETDFAPYLTTVSDAKEAIEIYRARLEQVKE
ncbi:hypothetical protein LJC20_05375 [Eubacteriales bacterium OttesenSCG-928-M02]|nr:hypothetical protein [Eubacteriales bacterium OttesenSCG-928-M02]